MIYSSYQILQVLLGKSESNFIRIISLFFFYTSYQLVSQILESCQLKYYPSRLIYLS